MAQIGLDRNGDTMIQRSFPLNRIRPWVKLIALAIVWAIIWLLLRPELYLPFLSQRFSISTAYVLTMIIFMTAIAIFGVVFLIWLVRNEKVHDYRKFFKIEVLDIKGIWLSCGLGLALQIFNMAFLWKHLLEPAKNFLLSLGISGPNIGLGTGEMVPQLSPLQAFLFTVFLLLFWWIEVPEELFFRGYIQNKLQEIVGKDMAIFLSALIWDFCHLWGLVNVVERFFYGLVYAFVFRTRQNTTGTMIDHAIGNRALLLGFVTPQIWGMIPNSQGTGTWLFVLGLYAILLLLVIACWKALKLDRRVTV